MDAELKRRRDIAQQVDALLGPLPEVTAVYVFGSVASGHVDERSDVDIIFVCSPEILPTSKRKEVLSRTGPPMDLRRGAWRKPDLRLLGQGVDGRGSCRFTLPDGVRSL